MKDSSDRPPIRMVIAGEIFRPRPDWVRDRFLAEPSQDVIDDANYYNSLTFLELKRR